MVFMVYVYRLESLTLLEELKTIYMYIVSVFINILISLINSWSNNNIALLSWEWNQNPGSNLKQCNGNWGEKVLLSSALLLTWG